MSQALEPVLPPDTKSAETRITVFVLLQITSGQHLAFEKPEKLFDIQRIMYSGALICWLESG